MARRWSGFLPQNLNVKEEWDLLEACEAKAGLALQSAKTVNRTRLRLQAGGPSEAPAHPRRGKR